MPYVPDPPFETKALTGARAPQGAFYASREALKGMLDFGETARNDAQIDRALASATASVEGLLHRSFFPWSGTRYFDWPAGGPGTPWRLWLNANEVIAITALESGGITIPSTSYLLYPADGPPYSRIEIDLSASSEFTSGATYQDAIAVSGVFGYGADTEWATVTTASVTTSATVLPTADSSTVGVGDVVLVDTEYMVVTGRSQADTSQTITADLGASNAAVLVPVSSGAAFHVGETLLIDAERLLVVDVAGNSLVVKRAREGSVLAAHTSGAKVYAPRNLTVTRAALAQEIPELYPGDDLFPSGSVFPSDGMLPATHASGSVVYRHVVPPLIEALTLAEASRTFMNNASGWSTGAGSGSSAPATQTLLGALGDLRTQAITAHGRFGRVRAV